MMGKTPRKTLTPGIAKVPKRLHYPLDVILLCVPPGLRGISEGAQTMQSKPFWTS
ncbi:hypothetical protein J2794_006304 [Paraburkholderia terricola]|nr:hypothetical protein [Paraburkholderia terricola]